MCLCLWVKCEWKCNRHSLYWSSYATGRILDTEFSARWSQKGYSSRCTCGLCCVVLQPDCNCNFSINHFVSFLPVLDQVASNYTTALSTPTSNNTFTLRLPIILLTQTYLLKQSRSDFSKLWPPGSSHFILPLYL